VSGAAAALQLAWLARSCVLLACLLGLGILAGGSVLVCVLLTEADRRLWIELKEEQGRRILGKAWRPASRAVVEPDTK
jgi:hypothetical protein